MKNVLLATVVTIVALVASGCGQQQHFTAWGLAESNIDNPQNAYTGRLGVCNGEEAGDTEFGFEADYSGLRDSPVSFGMFGIYHLAGDSQSWIGQPYIGYRLGTDGDGSDFYGPIFGTIYREIFVIEARVAQEFTGKLAEEFNDENDEDMVAAGLRFEF